MTTQQHNRVQSMKEKFENLSSLEPLDISIPSTRKVIKNNNNKYKFQRSSTNFNLLSTDRSVELIHKLKINSQKVLTEPFLQDSVRGKSIKNSLSFNQGYTENVHEFESRYSLSPDNTQVKLIRQTSDPLRRGSVKRSPAFREPSNKLVANKLSPQPIDSIFNTFERQMSERRSESTIVLTDTLRKALKQPLPDGPPPRKPPRTFESPIREVKDIESNEGNGNISLNLNKNNEDLSNKTNIKSSLNNFSCSPYNPIYDTVITEEEDTNKDNIDIKNEFNSKTISKSLNPSEHIYMEPFGHLKSQQNIKKFENSEQSENVLNQTQCGCPEQHSTDDLHYMCTVVSDNYPSSENKNKEIKDDSSSSNDSINANAYDEINSIVNAAFDDKTIQLADETIAITEIPKNQSTLYNGKSVEEDQKTINKVSRSLTEKRKNYIRRVSTTNIIINPPVIYAPVQQSFKSPILRTFSASSLITDLKVEPTSERINKYNQLINANKNNNNNTIKEDSNGTRDKSYSNSKYNKPEIMRDGEKLFEMCLLIGFNLNSNNAYIKMTYPEDIKAPENIEQLVFPNASLCKPQSFHNQEYCLLLTDDNGIRIYGYCRRIIPESSEICLPLSYCLLTKVYAPGFYFKLLKEIESRHGQTELQRTSLLKNVQMMPIPSAGKFLHLVIPNINRPKSISMNPVTNNTTSNTRRLSLEANPKWLTESASQQMQHSLKKLEMTANKDNKISNTVNGISKTAFDLTLINRSLLKDINTQDEILIKRPNDLRLESTELNDLFQCTGIELLLNIFGTILLERKVILYSENISLLTSCVMGLQSIIYPLQWPFPLITILPHTLTETCSAPFPVLVGTIENIEASLIENIEDGILVDLDKKLMLKKCGDENTILPDSLRKSLIISLEMIGILKEGKMLSSVMISEAFLRFFIELFFNIDFINFDKQTFIDDHSCPSVRLFLEWFLETSMFQNFIKQKTNNNIQENDNANKNFYALFNSKLMENKNKTNQNMELILKNCRIINRKAKKFKDRFKDLF